MRAKKLIYMLLAFAVMANCVIVQVNAAETCNEPMRLEDMACELIDLSALEPWEEYGVSRIERSIRGNISAKSISAVSPTLFLQAGGVVTFNCSYSPSSASMDFGVLTPDGIFYYTSVKGGSINQTIGITQSGSYAVAIRNNSSQTVSVVGFVEY